MNWAIDLEDIRQERSALRQIVGTEFFDELDEERLTAIDELDSELALGIDGQIQRAASVLIHEDEFEDYAREFVADVEGIDLDGIVAGYVRWSDLADTLKNDYQTVEFDGDTYLIGA